MKSISVGDKLTKVEIKIDAAINVTNSKVEDFNVIGVSKHFAVMDNDLFDKLAMSKTFEFGYSKPDKVSISEYTSDFDIKYFGKFSISGWFTSKSKKVIENKVNREFNKWLENKMSSYGAAKKVEIKL